ncbi:MAG: sigma-54 factor interaction domain-containing protein, partial [Planctomycetes bacterium]|nr:sigma-54 factor interaction domain-containing protein [Planctomycetota bacterium]
MAALRSRRRRQRDLGLERQPRSGSARSAAPGRARPPRSVRQRPDPPPRRPRHERARGGALRRRRRARVRAGVRRPEAARGPAVLSSRADIAAAFDALLARAATEAPDLLPELAHRAFAAAAPKADLGGDDAEPWHGIVGRCPAMLALRERIAKFAAADAPALVTGESGTGKERVACAIHALSRRCKGPFVAENCAAIPESLLESVLFGHKKGAFTGAVKDHPGHFVAATGGTIFLDEIGEIS